MTNAIPKQPHQQRPVIRTLINKVVRSNELHTLKQRNKKAVRVAISFNDQKSANVVRKQLEDLSLKIRNADVVAVFTSAKIEKDLKHSEVNSNE